MSKKLWFIKEDLFPIAVFDDHDIAKEELFYIKEDSPTGNYKIYGMSVNEVEDYSDEMDLAVSEGYIEN